MKLNPDCIRDILLAIEEDCSFRSTFQFPGNNNRLSSYSEDEVLYHIKQCELSDLVYKVTWFIGGSCCVKDLAPSGHQFLADIRSENIWSKTKITAAKVGSSSLNTLVSIASSIVAGLVKGQLGI